jgi:DNA primase
MSKNLPKLTSDDYLKAIQKLHLKIQSHNISSMQIFIVCPYHNDDHPSLSISLRTGAYQCFQCHRYGHLSQFVKERSGMSIYQLLDIDTTEIDFDNFIGNLKENISYIDPIIKKDFNIININIRGILVPWSESKEAIEYLKLRSIDFEIANKANIMYTSESIINDMYYNTRLCIPIYSEYGNLINMEGRDVTFNQKKKCIYPKDTIKPIYEWYKLDYSKPIYIFEGLIKMLVSRSDDYFSNSTTSFGCYISEIQADQLKLFKHIIIVPDNDDAGKTFINQIKINSNPNSKIEILRILNPEIKDADEIPKKSGLSIREFRLANGFLLENNYFQ